MDGDGKWMYSSGTTSGYKHCNRRVNGGRETLKLPRNLPWTN